ncbi:alpha-amylase family glycosyl hydrolase [Haloactinomyces albus]|uniref:Alpha-glucosidase n=1 Tax=Haloactinomyces albus TaxID=1352928 RepID=A0AAE3ZCV3_9ACTN|nr:alpha-amylase family glycosyl hydrolase [Haloactinomyces albus]MDR7301204.1 alpha-glucosidase [Haloactinomyces albus]
MWDLTGSQRRYAGDRPWWHRAVNYRVDVRSFRDSDGDGIGDLEGVRSKLEYLDQLGIDALWLTGILAGPISEPSRDCDVDPMLGDLGSYDKLIAEAHGRGISILMDLAAERSGIDQPGFGGELARALRFWIGRGVDGFRVGVSPGMTRPADEAVSGMLGTMRSVLAEHPRCLIGAFVDERFPRIPGLGRLDLGTDVRFGSVSFDAAAVRNVIDGILADFASVDTYPVWVLAGWDRPRPAGQHGEGRTGLARARAMALVQLALPGIAGLDNGDELGLAETNTSDRIGSQPARGPMPWMGADATFGFTDAPYTPAIPQDWQHLTVEAQTNDPTSTLSLHRAALALRRTHHAFRGSTIEWYGAPAGCLAFRRGSTGLVCALNTSRQLVPLPPGEVLLSSGPLTGNRVPPDTAVWLA